MINNNLIKILIYVCMLMLVALIYPFQYGFYGDDINVISEKVYFNNNFDWLKHLLFFNQNRITYSGDYLLVRPFLFFNTWALDVLFREERIIHYLVSISLTTLAAMILLKESLQNNGLILSFLMALSFLIFDHEIGGVIFYWSHLNPYILSLILFYYGIKIVHDDNIINSIHQLCGFILIELSILSHEYVFIAVNLLFLYFLISNTTSDKKYIKYYLFLIIINIILYYYALIGIGIPEIFSPGEVTNSKIIENVSSGALILLLTLLKKLFLIKYSLLIIIILFSIIYISIRNEKLKGINRIECVAYLCAYIAIVIGIFIGRVVTRGGYSGWYDILMCFYGILVLKKIIAIYDNPKKKYAIYFIMVFILINGYKLLKINQEKKYSNEYESKKLQVTVQNIKNKIKSNDNVCYGGVFDNVNSDARSIDLLLNNYSCNFKSNKKPLYFNEDGETEKIDSYKIINNNIKTKFSNISNIHLLKNNDIVDILFKNEIKGNIYSKKNKEIIKESNISECIEFDKFSMTSFQVIVISEEKNPILYNFYIKISDRKGNLTLVGFANNSITFYSSIDGIIIKKNQWSNSQQELSIIKFIESNKGINVIHNSHIIGLMPLLNNEKKLNAEFCTFDNGSLKEKLVGINILEK